MTFLIRLIIILSIVLLPLYTYATCKVDNTATPNGSVNTMTNFLAGQQFLACETNDLLSVQVQTVSGGTIDLYLVAGDGNAINYGTPYQTFSAQPSGLVTLNLTNPFSVTSGNLYSFAIGNPVTGLDVVFDMTPVGAPVNPGIPDGQHAFSYSDAGVLSLSTASDLVFGINIGVPVVVAAISPIPTMSQWGLVIFGLLIMNLGVFFVYRIEMA